MKTASCLVNSEVAVSTGDCFIDRGSHSKRHLVHSEVSVSIVVVVHVAPVCVFALHDHFIGTRVAVALWEVAAM